MGELKASTAAIDLVLEDIHAAHALRGRGVGAHRSRPRHGLAEERFNQGRFFGGINVNLIALNLAFEAEKMGDNLSLSAKLGWRF
jgi:hypothetical protein